MRAPFAFTRRTAITGLAAATLPLRTASAASAEDFEVLWTTLRDRYCFFDKVPVDWNCARRTYAPFDNEPEALTSAIVALLAELQDAHTHLRDAPDGTPRNPPFDILAEASRGGVRIRAVLNGSSAAKAGLAHGDVIDAVDGEPPRAAMQRLRPRCHRTPSADAHAFVLNRVLAGRRGLPRTLNIAGRGLVTLPLDDSPDEPDVTYRRLGSDIGLIRIASFADDDAVATFDKGLEVLRTTRGLILDVRDNGGGDTAVARPMMGRFIDRPMLYALMRRREGSGLSAAWREVVEPRGPFRYEGRVVILCNHWSASMAEGFPMGMRAIVGATIVGTRMMGLGAAVATISLPSSGLTVQYSAEPVYDVLGRPRSLLRPDVVVAEGQDVLSAGLATLRRMLV